MTRLELVLPVQSSPLLADLARRESECCSFFTFEFESLGDDLGDDVVMHIAVPPEHVGLLDAPERSHRELRDAEVGGAI